MYYTLNQRTKVNPPLSAAQYEGRYQWLSLDMAEPNLGLGNVVGPWTYVLTTSGEGERIWTRNLNLSGNSDEVWGSIVANLGFFETLSANNLEGLFRGEIFTRSLTALKANILDWERRIDLIYLDQSGAEVGDVPIWNGISWQPGNTIIDGFPGNRLHDFVSLSTYGPNLSADYSYCGAAIVGFQPTDPQWRIIRLRYSEAGLIDEVAVAYPIRWTERYTGNYIVILDSDLYGYGL